MLMVSVNVCSMAVPAAAQQVEGEISADDDRVLDGTTDEVQGDVMPINDTGESQPVADVEIESDADAEDQSGTSGTSEINQDDNVEIAADDKPYLALGENLSAEQKATVLNLMGIDPANLDNYNVVSITNAEEHQYLDEYLPAEKIGTRALYSVVIVQREQRILTIVRSACTKMHLPLQV